MIFTFHGMSIKNVYPAFVASFAFYMLKGYEYLHKDLKMTIKTTPSSINLRKFHRDFTDLCDIVQAFDRMISPVTCLYYLASIGWGCANLYYLFTVNIPGFLKFFPIIDSILSVVLPFMMISVFGTLLNEEVIICFVILHIVVYLIFG